jgi:putative ABC transport system permease protein
LRQAVNREFPSLAAASFMDLGASYLEIAKSKRVTGLVFLLLLLLIAAVGIFNTVLMSVYERIREVGVLRAHGMMPGQITGMFVLEGFLTGLLGAALGVALGAIVNFLMVTYGYPLDKIAGDMGSAGFPYWGRIYGEWNPTAYVALTVFSVALATVAGIIPARRAGSMPVTKALKFV